MTTITPGPDDLQPAPPENQVRIETTLHGETAVHDVNTRVFLKSIGVARRGDHIQLTMGPVKITMRRSVATAMMSDALHMLDTDSKIEVVEPIVRQLQDEGYHPDRKRSAKRRKEDEA